MPSHVIKAVSDTLRRWEEASLKDASLEECASQRENLWVD